MRLNKQEVNSIIQVLDTFLTEKDAKLYLYGSRVRDNLKGGDIDLLLLSSQKQTEHLNNNKLEILVALKKEIGDRRIDLSFHYEKNAFVESVLKQTVLLKQW